LKHIATGSFEEAFALKRKGKQRQNLFPKMQVNMTALTQIETKKINSSRQYICNCTSYAKHMFFAQSVATTNRDSHSSTQKREKKKNQPIKISPSTFSFMIYSKRRSSQRKKRIIILIFANNFLHETKTY